MKKNYQFVFAIYLGFVFPNFILGQDCQVNYILSTQSEIDNFSSSFPSCSVIEGNVTITGEDINNISPLSWIETIKGDLSINNCPNLLRIEGIEIDIHQKLKIYNNDTLQVIRGFDSLDSLRGVSILNNESLDTLAGFSNLRLISDSISIRENDELVIIPTFNTAKYIREIDIAKCISLDKVTGFNQLDSTDCLDLFDGLLLSEVSGFENLKISGTINISTRSIYGFNNVEQVRGTLALKGITQSEPITVFNKLKSIGFNLTLSIYDGEFNSLLNLEEVQFNDIAIIQCHFQNLDFLSNMKRMDGFEPYIRINNCPNLTDISGLDNIDSETVDWFYIYNNPKLSICHSELVCAVLERGDEDPSSIWNNNGPGCNSTEEILAQCADKPDEPEVDPILCPIASRPGMQIDKIRDDRYDIMYHYGIKRMYLKDIAYLELLELIEYHKVEKDILFDFNTFSLENYCERAEELALGVTYDTQLPNDPIMQDIIDRVMSEIDFFSNFVLTIDEGECVKL